MANGWGGARSRSGPRSEADRNADGQTTITQQLDAVKLEHERVKMAQREHALAVQEGRYLPRDATRAAAQTALAVLTQSLRSIPDNCERKFALPPEVVQAIQDEVDAALNNAAVAYKAMTKDEDAGPRH